MYKPDLSKQGEAATSDVYSVFDPTTWTADPDMPLPAPAP